MIRDASSQGEKNGPELVIGLVCAAGTDLKKVLEYIKERLQQQDYITETIVLSKLMGNTRRFGYLRNFDTASEDIRIRENMKAGTEIRQHFNSGDGVVRLTLLRIRNLRKKYSDDGDKAARRVAYILKSLKHPEEVLTLRKLFGDAFILVSVYEPQQERVANLAQGIARSHNRRIRSDDKEKAKTLIEIDRKEAGEELGQRVEETYHMADFFLRQGGDIEQEINRFFKLLFGAPYITPTKDEYLMFFAQAAALRSADLSRQVGAIIATERGEIISGGCNEVPQAGGGFVWNGDVSQDKDYRDYRLQEDASTIYKNETIQEIFEALKKDDRNWLSEEMQHENIERLAYLALRDGDAPPLKGTRVAGLLEFGRVVHAEMAAITEAAKRGIPVKDGILYVTTFPCHMCARHILASGIERVVYIEPYPKSLTKELYAKAVKVDGDENCDNDAVVFEPFVGVAPTRYLAFYKMGKRKNAAGYALDENQQQMLPRIQNVYNISRHHETGYLEGVDWFESIDEEHH